jgi:hypothetical protein
VHVRVDQAGDDRTALQVDHAAARAGERPDVGRGADRHDLAVAHGERFGCRHGSVQGHDLAVEQHRVGVLAEGGRPKTRGGQRQRDQRRDDRFHGGTSRVLSFTAIAPAKQ